MLDSERQRLVAAEKFCHFCLAMDSFDYHPDLLAWKKLLTKKINPEQWDSRPDWDSWFMALCFVVAQRSLDKDTKHGCVVVDESKTILSVGYNSPPRGCDDELVPLERPAKYDYMKHAEANAIVNAARTGTCLKGATFYNTGLPCHDCFGDMINVGAKRIIHGPTPSAMLNSATNKITEFMKRNQDIEVIELENIHSVLQILSNTEQYIHIKTGNHYEQEKS